MARGEAPTAKRLEKVRGLYIGKYPPPRGEGKYHPMSLKMARGRKKEKGGENRIKCIRKRKKEERKGRTRKEKRK